MQSFTFWTQIIHQIWNLSLIRTCDKYSDFSGIFDFVQASHRPHVAVWVFRRASFFLPRHLRVLRSGSGQHSCIPYQLVDRSHHLHSRPLRSAASDAISHFPVLCLHQTQRAGHPLWQRGQTAPTLEAHPVRADRGLFTKVKIPFLADIFRWQPQLYVSLYANK